MRTPEQYESDSRERSAMAPRAEGFLHPPISAELAEPWCTRCDQPADAMIRLTTGELVARCSEHAWLLRAPRGIVR